MKLLQARCGLHLHIGLALVSFLFAFVAGAGLFFSTAATYQGNLYYQPYCIPLYIPSGVHVFGNISPSSPRNVRSVSLWWRYHASNIWYELNDFVLGPSFSSDGNFSHRWNPPSVAYYDFETNWTLSSGQVISTITKLPFQVVSQNTSCPPGSSASTTTSSTPSSTDSGRVYSRQSALTSPTGSNKGNGSHQQQQNPASFAYSPLYLVSGIVVAGAAIASVVVLKRFR